jgi:polyphosphate glucokinase
MIKEGNIMNVLVVDIGGSNIKILATRQKEPRKFSSGPEMTVERMVAGVKDLTGDWKYDVVSIGYPGTVLGDRVVSEPHNPCLGLDWGRLSIRLRMPGQAYQ